MILIRCYYVVSDLQLDKKIDVDCFFQQAFIFWEVFFVGGHSITPDLTKRNNKVSNNIQNQDTLIPPCRTFQVS